MEYLAYALIGISIILFIFKRISNKGNELIKLFWDGYRIYRLTGDDEARVALLVGLGTVGAAHKELLLEAIKRDSNEDRLMFKLANQEMDEETKCKMELIYPNFENIKQLSSDEVDALARLDRQINQIIEYYSSRESSIQESIALKLKFKNTYPNLISLINGFKVNYFRLKYASFNEPNFYERIKAWALSDGYSNSI